MNKSLGAYVLHLKGVLSQRECADAVHELNTKLWRKHAYHNEKTGEDTTYDDDLEVLFEDSYSSKMVMPKIDWALREYVNEYKFPWLGVNDRSMVRFNKYEIGAQMRIHADHITTLFDGTRRGIPVLTVLGVLNEDYEGGEFVLFDNLVIPFKTGDIVVFPSNFLYPHAVQPVTKGTRYSYVSWSW